MLDDSDGTVIKVSYGPAVRMIVIAAFLFFSALAAAACLQGYSVYTVGFALLFVAMDAMLVPFVFFANIRFSEAWEYFIFTFCHRQYRVNYSDCCSCGEEGLQTIIRLSPQCAHRFGGFAIRRIVLDRFMTNRDAFIHTLHSKHVQTGCDKVCGTVTVKTRTDVTAALLFWVTGISLLYIYIRLEGSRDIYEANKALVNTVFGVMIGLPLILAIIHSWNCLSTIIRRIGDEDITMDIKTKIENFFINIALGPVLAKRERVFGNREQEMNRWIKAFFSAIKGGDISKIKALFARNAIDEIGDQELESMIINFLSFFSGEFVDSKKLLVDSHGTMDHGKKSDILMGSMEITSTGAEYKLAIKIIPYDDFNADNIGIWSINIIQKEKDSLSEHNYTGDGQYRTGIYLDVPRPLR